METKELIEALERARILSGVRGWGVETIAEIIKRLEALDKMVAEEKKAKLIWDATCPGIDATWLPSAENINALPKPLYDYIAGLETNADPPSMVADNIILRDTVKALEIKLEEERPMVDQAFVNIWADKYLTEGDVGYIRKQVKLMLAEAGVEVKNGNS